MKDTRGLWLSSRPPTGKCRGLENLGRGFLGIEVCAEVWIGKNAERHFNEKHWTSEIRKMFPQRHWCKILQRGRLAHYWSVPLPFLNPFLFFLKAENKFWCFCYLSLNCQHYKIKTEVKPEKSKNFGPKGLPQPQSPLTTSSETLAPHPTSVQNCNNSGETRKLFLAQLSQRLGAS